MTVVEEVPITTSCSRLDARFVLATKALCTKATAAVWARTAASRGVPSKLSLWVSTLRPPALDPNPDQQTREVLLLIVVVDPRRTAELDAPDHQRIEQPLGMEVCEQGIQRLGQDDRLTWVPSKLSLWMTSRLWTPARFFQY